jgi:hypothetical protein
VRVSSGIDIDRIFKEKCPKRERISDFANCCAGTLMSMERVFLRVSTVSILRRSIQESKIIYINIGTVDGQIKLGQK